MKTLRLIIGIISIVLVLLIMFQSCAAGLGNIISGSDETSGISGFIFSICLLIAGIVGVVTHKGGSGGSITSIIFYVIGGLIGVSNYGSFADLKIWSVLSFIFASLYLISIVFGSEKKNKKDIQEERIIQPAEIAKENNSIEESETLFRATLRKIPKLLIIILIIAFILLISFLLYVIISSENKKLETKDPNSIYTQAVNTVVAGMTQTAANDPFAIYTQVAGTIMAQINPLIDISTPEPTIESSTTTTSLGTRSNPVPFGQPLDLKYQDISNFQMTILEVTRGENAWNMVSQANMFNEPPAEGLEYAVVKMGISYQTSTQQDYVLSIDSYNFKSVSNNQILDSPSVVQPEPALDIDLFPGGYGEGYIVIQVYIGDTIPLVIYEDWISFDSEPFYFSIS